MKKLSYAYRLLTRGALISVLFTLLIFLATAGDNTPSIGATSFLSVLLFGFLLGVSFEVYKLRRLSIFLRILLHIILSILIFLALFTLTGNIRPTFTNVAIFSLINLISYGIISAFVFPLLRAVGYYQKYLSTTAVEKKKTVQETPYQKRFG